jgi:hypothetical protein
MALLMSALTLMVVPSKAAAQQGGPAAGGGSNLSAPGRSLDLNIWLGSGHHERIIHGSQDAIAIDPSVGADNSHGQFGLNAVFSRRRQRLVIDATAETAARAESAGRQLWAADHRGALRVVFSPTNRTRVEAAQSAKYAAINPLVGTSLTPGNTEPDSAPSTPLGHSFPIAQAFTSSTSTVVTHTLSRRSALVFTQGFAYSDGDEGGALVGHSGGARFERSLNRNQLLRLGYRLTAAIYDPVNRRYLQSHDIDAGVEYKRGLPFSPHTTLRATTGASMVSDRERRAFRMLADVSLEHTLSRTWEARLDFSRPVQVVEGLTAPVISSSVALRLAGTLSRRHGVFATATYSDGSVSLDYSRLASVTSYSSSFRWQTTVSRNLALNAEMFHGRAQFGPEVAVLPSVPRDSEQLGVRFFVSLWRPIIRD